MQEREEIESPSFKKGDLINFLGGIEKSLIVSRAGTMGLLVMAGLMGWNNYSLTQQLKSMTETRPVMVVPGAAAGVYTPGLLRENLLNLSRYLVGLRTNFTKFNIEQRSNEFASFMAPASLAEYQAKTREQVDKIKSRDESRSFVKENDDLQQQADGSYKYSAVGAWTFFSSSVVLDQSPWQVDLVFRVIQASKNNPYGIEVISIETRPLGDKAQAQPGNT